MNTDPIITEESAAQTIKRLRAEREREQLEALARARARRQPITPEELCAWQERALGARLPATNARAREVQAWRQSRLTSAPKVYPLAPPPEPPREVPAWRDDPPIPSPDTAKKSNRNAARQKAEGEARIARAIELHDKGWSPESIAAELDITEYTVRRRLREAGIKPAPVMPSRRAP